jgi:hypothetical protein
VEKEWRSGGGNVVSIMYRRPWSWNLAIRPLKHTNAHPPHNSNTMRCISTAAPAHPRIELVGAYTQDIDGVLTTAATIIEKEIRGGDMECLYLLG